MELSDDRANPAFPWTKPVGCVEAMIACQRGGVADYIGGLAGLTTSALGAASGIANGAGERERFDASQWHKPSPAKQDRVSFREKLRVSLPGLQGSLTREELDVLVSAKGGRKLCGCADRTCCLHGYDDMLKEPRGHSARQQVKVISALEKVPDLLRASHFLNGPLRDAESRAGSLENLRPNQAVADEKKVDPVKLMERLRSKGRERIHVATVPRGIDEQRGGEWPRARPIVRQPSFGPLFRRGRP